MLDEQGVPAKGKSAQNLKTCLLQDWIITSILSLMDLVATLARQWQAIGNLA